MKFFYCLNRLSTCNRAVAVVEFALIFPVLLVVFLGVIEFTRLALFYQKVDKVVHSMSDFVTQSEGSCIGTDEMDVFTQAADQIMEPFEFDGTIIFTSVSASLTPQAPCTIPNQACISWQYTPIGNEQSKIGKPGDTGEHKVAFPGGMTLAVGQNVIISEVTYPYSPLLPITANFIPSLDARDIYRVAVYKPRVGSLTQRVIGSCPPPPN